MKNIAKTRRNNKFLFRDTDQGARVRYKMINFQIARWNLSKAWIRPLQIVGVTNIQSFFVRTIYQSQPFSIQFWTSLTVWSRRHPTLTYMSLDVVLPSHCWSTLRTSMCPRAPLQQPLSPPSTSSSCNMSCPSPLPLSNHLNDIPNLSLRSRYFSSVHVRKYLA